MKPIRTWILIANSETARIVENCGPGKGIHQVKEKVFEARKQEQHSDHEGRTFSSASNRRHKMETPSAGLQGNREFVSEIMETLQTSFASGEFERLIICASPKTLGLLQKQIPNGLKSLEIDKLDRDLTHIPTDKLPRHFEDFLPV